MNDFNLDSCLFQVSNKINQTIYFYSQLEECLECPLLLQKKIKANQFENIYLSTKYRQFIRIKNEKDLVCNFDYKNYKDQAVYNLSINYNSVSKYSCELLNIYSGRQNIWPLVILCTIITSLLSYNLLKSFFKSYLVKQNNQNENLNRFDSLIKHTDDLSSQRTQRSDTVDVFRGIVILFMIFVNYGAGGYTFLQHSPWFGMTVADLIFPAFMFLMGCSLGFSLKNLVSKQENIDIKKVCLKIFKRSLVLFFIGLIINSIGQNDLTKLRIPGVLQRFSICYLILALIHLNSLLNSKNEPKFLSVFYKYHLSDIYPFFNEWIFMFIITGLYIYFTLFFSYKSNCELGYQGPGGLHKNSSQSNCTGGAARTIDIWVFGQNHIYQKSTSQNIYHNNLNHEPEGLLGTLTNLLIVFFGLQVTKIQTSFSTTRMKISRWILYSVILGLIALILDYSNVIPICKNLWSLSFVFITSSICFFIFTCLYLIIDNKKIWYGQPFKSVGKNALFLYLGHEICGSIFPFYYEVDETSHYLLLMRCSIATLIWLLIAVYMGRKRIFIKI